jgi:CheY-like chemotaxis protein
MVMQHILLADDNQKELDELKAILEDGNYRVETASSPDQAMELLQPKRIKAAVIDYRLNGGGDDDDSGLFVAQNASRGIPKIMVSGLADERQIRALIGTDNQGRQIVFEFLDKNEIIAKPAKLLTAIERAIQTRELWERTERESISGQLLTDYLNARRFDLANTLISFVVNLAFIGLLAFTVILAHSKDVGIVLSATVSLGIIVSEITVNLLLAKRLEGSSRRAENYHAELLQAWRFEQLMKSAEGLDYVQARNRAKTEVITAFSYDWQRRLDSVNELPTERRDQD